MLCLRAALGALGLAGSLGLAGCSPALNWRDVAIEGVRLQMQLPCKPDRTTRSVPLGGTPVELQVVGCEAGDAIVAVMTAVASPGSDPQALLQGWQQATLANARARLLHSQTWHRPGQLPLAAAQRIQAEGQRADGQPVQLQAVWGAVTQGDRVRLLHAVVYAPQGRDEPANTLFDSLRP